MSTIKLKLTLTVEVDPDRYELAYGVAYRADDGSTRAFCEDVVTYVEGLVRDGAASDSGIVNATVRS